MREKAILVTRKTRLEELVARFNTRAQARFYIEHAGGDFADYAAEDETYRAAVATLEQELSVLLKVQVIDRSFLPGFLFAGDEIVVAVGQDGLVANTAKYTLGLPLLGVNPDPGRFDGILLAFQVAEVAAAVRTVAADEHRVTPVTLARVDLNDGQHLLAFNDLFLGARSHVSARYRLELRGRSETQSSSGLLVATGAGSTGWLSSVCNMINGVARDAGAGGDRGPRLDLRFPWGEERLVFAVREPFVSQTSGADICLGTLGAGEPLVVESLMPSGGVIFSDGVENDFLAWNSGATARIRVAPEKALLVAHAGTRLERRTGRTPRKLPGR